MNNSLAAGFHTPILEIVAVIVIFLAIGIGMFVYTRRTERAKIQRRLEAVVARYNELTEQLDLSLSDRRVIEQLATYLPPGVEPYRLLENQGVFTRAASMALDDREVGPGQISAIRVKLGFVGRSLGMRPRSSVDLPIGAALEVRTKNGRTYPVRIVGSDPAALHLAADSATDRSDTPDSPRRLPRRGAIWITYQNAAGVFSFDSAVLGHDDGGIAVQHSERIVVQQRREFFRRALRTPVKVVPVSREDRSIAMSVFIDIGGDGASLRNPSHNDPLHDGPAGRARDGQGSPRAGYTPGDWIDLVFAVDRGAKITVPATVIRTSQNDTVLHVRYRNIRESTRDRIYRFLFSYDEDDPLRRTESSASS